MSTPAIVTPTIFTLMALRSFAFLMRLQNRKDAALVFDHLADLAQAGRMTEEHMKLVTASIRRGDIADFADIRRRIIEHGAQLQDAEPTDAPQPEPTDGEEPSGAEGTTEAGETEPARDDKP